MNTAEVGGVPHIGVPIKAKNIKSQLLLLVILVAVVANWWPMLFTGDGPDIAAFRHSVQPFSFEYVTTLLSPAWGWAYRPIMLVYFSIGLATCNADPVTMHAISLGLHLVVLGLFFTLVLRLFRSELIALLSLTLFAIGTLNNQAVAWICSTSTLFATIFFLTTLHLWLSWRESGKSFYYPMTVMTCGLAIVSKEEAVAILPVIMVLDYYQGKRWKGSYSLLPYLPIVMGVMLFAIASNIARQSIDLADAKIAPVVLYPGLAAPASNLQGALLGIFESYNPAINLWAGLLIGAYCWNHGAIARGLFLCITFMALPVPFLSADADSRFRYLPMLAGSTLIAYLVLNKWRACHLADLSKLQWALLCALGVGAVRALVLCCSWEFAFHASPNWNLRQYLTVGFPLVPALLGCTVAAAYLLWRTGRLPQDFLMVIVLVSGGSQINQIVVNTLSFTSGFHGSWNSLWVYPVALLVPGLAIVLNERQQWHYALLVVALWELPALVLPLWLVFYLSPYLLRALRRLQHQKPVTA